MTIDKPGVYMIPAKQYHTDDLLPVPTLNCGAIKDLVNYSPLHCWAQHPRLGGGSTDKLRKRHMERGSALHSLLLGSGEEIVSIDADSYRSKDAQAQRDEAIQAWKIPLLYADYREAQIAADAIRKQLDAHADAHMAFKGGHPEMTLIWEEDGIWCRARLDYLADRQYFDDAKFTEGSANPAAWSKFQLFRMGYDIQAAFYTRGLMRLGLHRRPIFRFVVGEMQAPFAVSAIACNEKLIAYGDMKVERAIKTWRKCLKDSIWPGYQNETLWADVPSYLFAEQEERRLQMEADSEGT